MKAFVKTICIITGLALLGIGVCFFLLLPRGTQWYAGRLESALSKELACPVLIGGIRLQPLQKALEIHDLQIGNPSTFKEGESLRCKSILIRPQLKTLFSDELIIQTIQLKNLSVHLRYELGRGTNLGDLCRKANEAAAAAEGTKRCKINEISCYSADLKLSSNLAPLAPIAMKMPAFTLNGIGADKALSREEAIAAVLEELIREVSNVGGILKQAGTLLKSELKDIRGK